MPDRAVKVYLKGDVSDWNRALLGAAATTKAFTKELDTSTDRATMLTQSILAVGPATVPIAAAAVPAVAGLSNQLAFAAAGAGVAALAFSGIGDALKAVNEYGLDPSAANLEKMNETLAQIGPQGREFVLFLQSLRPKLEEIQNVAQAGLLPGVQEGMTELLDLLPQVERIVGTVASTTGDLVAEAGDNLNDPRWVEFFEFLDSEARPTLIAMGRTLGNFTEGFASLWMAFEPLSNQFSASFLELARDFAAWTDGLDQTEGFQEFVAYIQENGPRAWDTLAAIGNALVEIVEAAAPVGSVALPVIEAVADSISALADSSIGPALIGTVAAISALSRALSLIERSNAGVLGKIFDRAGLTGTAQKIKDVATATTELRIAQQRQASAAVAARDAQLGLVPTAQRRAALRDYTTATKELTEAEVAYSTALRSRRAQYARLAGGAALLGASLSGLDEKVGLSNTTMGATIGLIAGPWGVAVGGGIGLAKDFAAANDDVWQAIDRANQALGDQSQSLEQQKAQLDAARAKFKDFRSGIEDDFGFSMARIKNSFEGIFGRSDIEEARSALDELEAGYRKNERAAQDQAFAEAGLAYAMIGASDATRDQTAAMLDNVAAANRARDAKLAAANAELGYEQALDDAAKQARKGKKSLDDNTQAGRDNLLALYRLAESWNQLTPAQQSAAGSSDRARREFIKTARQMGATEQQAKDLADQYLDIPSKVTTRVQVSGIEAARDAVRAFDRALDAINPFKRVTIETVRHGVTKNARGGYISGPGTATSDSIPALLSNGEYVINAAATARHRSLLDEINANRYAGGGFVSPSSSHAAAPAFGPLAVSLVGAQVAIDPHTNIATFVRGEIRASIDANARYESAGRRGR